MIEPFSDFNSQTIHMGDLVITVTRSPDKTIKVRVVPGKENVHLIHYPQGA